MSRYVSYEEYEELLNSPLVPASEWESCELAASYFLDKITYGRISKNNIDLQVRLAVCAVSESNYLEKEALKGISQTVKSFNNDGYSETEFSPDSIKRRFDNERMQAAGLYLPRSHPLRYAGI